MGRPQISDDTRDRLDDMIEETKDIRPGYLTFEQKINVLLDELESERERNAVAEKETGNLRPAGSGRL